MSTIHDITAPVHVEPTVASISICMHNFQEGSILLHKIDLLT